MATRVREKLGRYRQKRDFSKTREPTGGMPSAKGRLFVIQEHHASRLHWDLRLELDGVLLSWAVPKEPPTQPGVRRLAIHVEDHPLDYAGFEGRIPKGEYGAGTVKIWDRGEWTSEKDPHEMLGYGKLEFDLDGDRLHGRYVLVKMDDEGQKQEQWLFFKSGSDVEEKPPKEAEEVRQAKKGKAPVWVGPMLCTKRETPPSGDDWLHEVKWDGYRVLTFVRNGKIAFKTRNQNPLQLEQIEKDLHDALDKGLLDEAVLDGELVGIDERGVSSFRLVHEAVAAKETADLIYYAFDLPFLDGMDLRQSPIEERKRALVALVEQIGSHHIRFSAHTEGDGAKLYENACASHLEGIISKKKGSPYTSARSANWVKARCEGRLEGWIGGFTLLKDEDAAVGSLLVGVKDEDGKLHYAGKVGTGFSHALRQKLFRELSKQARDKSAFEASPDLPKRGATWVEPRHEVKVQYLEWSPGGVMRQPKLIEVPGMAQTKAKPASIPKSRPKPEGSGVNITHPGRVVDGSSKLTKGDVAAFYEAAAEWILPYVAHRPLPVLRCPDGVEKGCFFHKHYMKGLSEAVARVNVEEESGVEEIYMAISDSKGLLSLVQMGVIEFHPWGSRVETLEKPDTLIFDLDPGEGMKWAEVVDAAHEVHEHLSSIGLESFAKLSGGKGVHLVVPVEPELEWDRAKDFCEQLARILAKQFPKRYTADLPKVKRKGKIFLDYLRNGRGATAVCAYSVRARAGLPVAMPVGWDEVTADLAPNAFGLKEAMKHLDRRKKDPWAKFAQTKQSLRKVLGEGG